MAVAFMMFILELRRNGGETAAAAENRHQPPNFFFAISRWIIHFWIIWAKLFFSSKNYPYICTEHLWFFFGWIVKYLKYYKSQMQKLVIIFCNMLTIIFQKYHLLQQQITPSKSHLNKDTKMYYWKHIHFLHIYCCELLCY